MTDLHSFDVCLATISIPFGATILPAYADRKGSVLINFVP